MLANITRVKDPRIREYIMPSRIVWKSDDIDSKIESDHLLLENRDGQVLINPEEAVCFYNQGRPASILLDFGIELHGGVQISIWNCVRKNELLKIAKVRVRFGESAMEAMSDIGGETNATNDHAMRDQVLNISFLGANEIGCTGFRFVRIDLLEEDCMMQIKSIRAVFLHRGLEYKGSFKSSDPLLNRIWETGAYTVYLNMQDYLWDGIKRDRMIWIGDMHPETSTIQAVFGDHDIVPASLDYVRDRTELPEWMNTFPSYSAWWIIIQHDWYMQNGDFEYLKEQKEYLISLLDQLGEFIQEDGSNTAPNPFLDWPSSDNQEGVKAGIHALFTLAIEKGGNLCQYLGEKEAGSRCRQYEAKLRQQRPWHANCKQAAALLALANIMDKEDANKKVLAVDGSRGVSTFYGFYVLQARAEAGDIQGSLECIREYWGGMLNLGATTFWEDFNIQWLENASRIDELTPPGMVDVHGTYGDYCYEGYRHSLCHGWASGPTAWLSRYVLGIEIVEAGCKKVKINPQLGDLEWVEGQYPTPYGNISVKHVKQGDGSVHTTINAPVEIMIERH
ncbi:alpha-L-rhamnosidase [Mesobacillus foraminis]|uniref:alpha-L-rhamnosidase-related protein n=1 Tax=Mesobacillus foraminis TaxID=279826 RepID=UPI001BE8B3AD|nr:alpha-L-rhamnosidase C-terminal domain-containing protein [Mesobacillus foraminis]MBT2757712.1 alpha-L-rhamnosidase [Mesobacillus foraminis]